MGAGDLTTEVPGAGNGELADGAANGHAAKKRKRQQARAAVAANGHVAKAPGRKPGPDAAANATATHAEPEPTAAAGDGDRPRGNGAGHGNGHVRGRTNGAVVADEPPVEEAYEPDLDEVLDETAVELREDELEGSSAARAAGGGRRARRRAAKLARATGGAARPRGRAAKRAGEPPIEPLVEPDLDETAVGPPVEPKLRRRAAKRAAAAQRATPAARRAELIATAATIAAAKAEAEAAPPATGPKRAATIVRRVVAFAAILMIPAAAYALVVTDTQATPMSHADATYLSAQLVTADQGVRRQLVRLRPKRTSPAIARTRDAILTARSLALELGDKSGADARALQRAVKLEAAWLSAVGSVLANPRSPMRAELAGLDATLRPALAALPGRAGRRKGGAEQLVRYARARAAAAGNG